MNTHTRYRFTCTLSFGDIYGQIIIWLIVIFASLAAALSLMNSPLYAFLTIALILVISLPFLLFAFVTTLLNHIEFAVVPPEEEENRAAAAAKSPVAVS
ncbi:hypothetical protein NW813_07340 [Synechococcus sp. R55.6]|jgi:hypothetical protein|uniref:hypothetical protein n=1 Tax=unclassified Synechococcus TaxID=2626047 RepID=UPI0039C27EE3